MAPNCISDIGTSSKSSSLSLAPQANYSWQTICETLLLTSVATRSTVLTNYESVQNQGRTIQYHLFVLLTRLLGTAESDSDHLLSVSTISYAIGNGVKHLLNDSILLELT